MEAMVRERQSMAKHTGMLLSASSNAAWGAIVTWLTIDQLNSRSHIRP
jgi:hypothetical protein